MSLRTYVPFLLEFPSSSQIPLFSVVHCLLKVEFGMWIQCVDWECGLGLNWSMYIRMYNVMYIHTHTHTHTNSTYIGTCTHSAVQYVPIHVHTYVPFLLEFPSSSQIPLFSTVHCLLKVDGSNDNMYNVLYMMVQVTT